MQIVLIIEIKLNSHQIWAPNTYSNFLEDFHRIFHVTVGSTLSCKEENPEINKLQFNWGYRAVERTEWIRPSSKTSSTYHTQQHSSLSCLLSACVASEYIQILKQDHWNCAQRWQQSCMPPVKVPVTSAGKWCTAGALETGSPKKRQQKVQWQRPVEIRNDLQGRTWQNSIQKKNKSSKTCTKTSVGVQHNMRA